MRGPFCTGERSDGQFKLYSSDYVRTYVRTYYYYYYVLLRTTTYYHCCYSITTNCRSLRSVSILDIYRTTTYYYVLLRATTTYHDYVLLRTKPSNANCSLVPKRGGVRVGTTRPSAGGTRECPSICLKFKHNGVLARRPQPMQSTRVPYFFFGHVIGADGRHRGTGRCTIGLCYKTG